MVKIIETSEEYNQIFISNADNYKLIIIDFFTTWCVPCQLLAPELEKMEQEFDDDVIIAKLDCDILEDVAHQNKILNLPTIKGFINKTNIFTIPGHPPDSVRTMIAKFIIPPILKSLLIRNPDELVVKYLFRIVCNILEKPEEKKYLQLKYENASVKKHLLSVKGVKECLFDIGFVDEKDRLQIEPSDLVNSSCTRYRRQLEAVLNIYENLNPTSVNRSESNEKSKNTNENNKFSPILTESEEKFFETIEFSRERCKLYEERYLRDIARAIIDTNAYVGFSQEIALKKLLDWFKYEFFNWFNIPNCAICYKPCTFIGVEPATTEEKNWLANDKVEIYQCNVCSTSLATASSLPTTHRFPRYNHPEMLLSTRTGRCGEWANCFSLILRTFVEDGIFLSARHIMDWTDHVWCEVFIKLDEDDEPDWVHVDPCEGAYNAPLMYKAGWNKEISYVIGVTLGTLDVQDVTWRYTDDFVTCLKNRKLVRESVLVHRILDYHNETDADKLQLIRELVSFLPPYCSKQDSKTKRQLTQAELQGRQTGSVEWRMARGELGNAKYQKLAPGKKTKVPVWIKRHKGTVIRPTENEIINGCIHIQYNCSVDKYSRPDDRVKSSDASESDNESDRTKSRLSRRRTNILRKNLAKSPDLDDDAALDNGDSNKASSSSNQVALRDTGAIRGEGETKNENDLLSVYTEGWQDLAYSWCNLKRKVEFDWEVVYLARIEGSPGECDGFVSWLIDVSETDKVIGEISIFASSAEFKNSKVQWFLASPKYPNEYELINGFIHTSKFTEQTQFTLTALLSSHAQLNFNFPNQTEDDIERPSNDIISSESSNMGWQHAQLCRQKSTDYFVKTLQIKVELKEREKYRVIQLLL